LVTHLARVTKARERAELEVDETAKPPVATVNLQAKMLLTLQLLAKDLWSSHL